MNSILLNKIFCKLCRLKKYASIYLNNQFRVLLKTESIVPVNMGNCQIY